MTTSRPRHVSGRASGSPGPKVRGPNPLGRALVARVLLAVAQLAIAPGALAAPAPDPTCDFPAQAAVSYRPTGDESPARPAGTAGATAREHTRGVQGVEPLLPGGPRGAPFPGVAARQGLFQEPPPATG